MSIAMNDLKSRLRQPAVQFLLRFGALALVFLGALRTPWVQAVFVQPFIEALVAVTAGLVWLFDSRVQVFNDILWFSDGRGAVQVLASCTALEVCALLTAAILAFPGKLKSALVGAIIGVLALQALNLIRIISLLYVTRVWQEPAVFQFLHDYVWVAFMGVQALIIFFLFVRWQSASEQRMERLAHSA